MQTAGIFLIKWIIYLEKKEKRTSHVKKLIEQTRSLVNQEREREIYSEHFITRKKSERCRVDRMN